MKSEFFHSVPVEDLKNLHWMARRYADGRQTVATSLFNEITRRLLAANISLGGADGTPWARDAGGRRYDGLTEKEAAMGREPDWTFDGLQREMEKLREENRILRAALDRVEDHWGEQARVITRVAREKNP